MRFFVPYIVKIVRFIEKKGHDYYARSNVKKALFAWRLGRLIRDFFIWLLGYDARILVLTGNHWGCAIGHIASMDYIMRLQQRDQFAFDEIHYYQDARFLANEYLLQQYSDNIKFFTFQDYQDNKDFVDLSARSLTILPFDGQQIYYQKLFAITENLTENYPIRTLPQGDINDGYQALNAIGLRRDGWFVTLHIRGDDYYKRRGMVDSNNPSARNGDIQDYIRAIDAILEHGGQVVLLGDKDKYVPAALQGRVIDYAHSAITSPALDIFLCAENLFFFGGASGISHVPSVFGKSALFANLLPCHGRPIRKGDFWLPKKIYHTQKQRLLTIKECFADDILTLHDSNSLHQRDLRVIDNNANELYNAVLDMLAYHGVIDRALDMGNQLFIDEYDHAMNVGYYGQCVPSFIDANAHLFNDD